MSYIFTGRFIKADSNLSDLNARFEWIKKMENFALTFFSPEESKFSVWKKGQLNLRARLHFKNNKVKYWFSNKTGLNNRYIFKELLKQRNLVNVTESLAVDSLYLLRPAFVYCLFRRDMNTDATYRTRRLHGIINRVGRKIWFALIQHYNACFSVV